MFRTALFFACALILGFALQAWAEDARVLPRGRSRFSVIYGRSAGITERFNAEGNRESITAPFNMNLDSSSLQSLSPQMKLLVDFLNLDSKFRYDRTQRDNTYHGMTTSGDASLPLPGDALSIGALNVVAEAERANYVVSYQYGLTDNLSVGFLVPVVKSTINVRYGITGDNTARDIYAFYAATGMSPTHEQALRDLATATTETFQSALQSLGYERFQSTARTGLGDIGAGGRFKYLDSVSRGGEHIHALQFAVIVPTGKLKKPSQLTEVDLGDGSWDFGLSHLATYRPNLFRALQLSHTVNYTYRLPGSRDLRIRKNASDFLPDASSEENVSQRLGDKLSLTLGVKYSVSKILSLATSYDWYWKRADKFQGSVADRDYSYLSEGTTSTLQTLQLGASLDSVQSFLDNQFPLPGSLNVNVYVPTTGRNKILAPFGMAELALYF